MKKGKRVVLRDEKFSPSAFVLSRLRLKKKLIYIDKLSIKQTNEQ